MPVHTGAIRFALGLTLLLAGALPGIAAPFWVAYEGNDYPENEGWVRNYGNEIGPGVGGAERTVEDGVLTIDSLRDDWIFDFSRHRFQSDPAPGETFVAEWRVFVDPRSDVGDAEVVIARGAEPAHVAFELASDSVRVLPGDVTVPLAPEQFHRFRFESQDMQTYTLQIDDALTLDGYFEDFTLLQGFVVFGDGVQGRQSRSQWDYFRYGIVPEPGASHWAMCVLAILISRRRAAESPRPDEGRGEQP